MILSSEIEIIYGCKKKNGKSQEMLYKHFYGYGMSIALRYANSRDEAVEILNDSFLKVFDSIKSFDESQSFKPWLRKIVINTAIDYYRKFVKFNSNYDSRYIPDEELSPDVIDNLNVEDILKLLNDLPEVYRITFNLYEIEGYTHDEISKMLNIAVSTSRSNLTRAKQLLRASFQKKFQLSYAEVV